MPRSSSLFFDVASDYINSLNQNTASLSINRKDFTFLSFIFSSDYFNLISSVYFHSFLKLYIIFSFIFSIFNSYNTSGARLMIFWNPFSLNSLNTGQNTRVDFGSPLSFIITHALSSDFT